MKELIIVSAIAAVAATAASNGLFLDWKIIPLLQFFGL
jgi:hypothetical protein